MSFIIFCKSKPLVFLQGIIVTSLVEMFLFCLKLALFQSRRFLYGTFFDLILFVKLSINIALKGIQCPFTFISNVRILVWCEVKKSWEAMHFILCTKRPSLRTCAINASHVYVIFLNLVQFVPDWGEVLAVWAPRCIEFYKPWLVTDDHFVF